MSNLPFKSSQVSDQPSNDDPLTQSQFLMYTSAEPPAAEQSFSPNENMNLKLFSEMSHVPDSRKNKRKHSILVFPRELVVETAPSMQKIMIKNLNQEKIFLEFDPSQGLRCDENIEIQPNDSKQVAIEICAKSNQNLSIKAEDEELFNVKVTYTPAESNNESMLSSSRYSQMSRSKRSDKTSSALQRLRSLSKEMKDRTPNLPLAQKINSNDLMQSQLSSQKKNLGFTTTADTRLVQNNMTASFNQEELKILEKQFDQIQHSDSESNTTTPNRQQDQIQFKDLEASPTISRTILRQDLDESAVMIDDNATDIQRVSVKNKISFTDMSGHENSSMALQHLTSAPKDQSYTYSMSQLKSPEVQNSDMKISQLQSEIKDFQKIIQTQHSLLQDEKNKREKAEEALTMSQLGGGNDQSILNQIQNLLQEEGDEKLQQLMNISLMQEKKKQAVKDEQILTIFKQKDDEIKSLTSKLKDLEETGLQDAGLTQKLQKQIQDKVELDQSLIRQESDQRLMALEEAVNSLEAELKEREDRIQEYEDERNRQSELKDENSILVQELERLEQENHELKQTQLEQAEEYMTQIRELQEKLSRSYQDIKKFANAYNTKSSEEVGIQTNIERSQSLELVDDYILPGVSRSQTLQQENTVNSGNVSLVKVDIMSTIDNRKGNTETDIGLDSNDLKQVNQYLQRKNQELQQKLLDNQTLQLQDFGEEFKLEITDQKDILIQQLREQVRSSENQFRTEVQRLTSSLRNQTITKENLQLQNGDKDFQNKLTKLQMSYNQIIQQRDQFLLDETTVSLHEALQSASKTISLYKVELHQTQSQLLNQDCLINSAIINRILTCRHGFLLTYIGQIQNSNDQIKEQYQQHLNQIQDFKMNSHRQAEDALSEPVAAEKLKIDQLQRQLNQAEKSLQTEISLARRRAEIEYDQRQTLRDEKIKQWLDSQVLKFLFMDGGADITEMTRKFCDLQVTVDQQIKEKELLQLELDVAKQQRLESQQTITDLELNIHERTQMNQIRMQDKTDQYFKKEAENLLSIEQLKKDYYSVQKIAQDRLSELQELKNTGAQQQFQDMFWKFESQLQNIETEMTIGKLPDLGQNTHINYQGPLVNQQMRAQLEDCQRELIELRAQQILESEEMKLDYQIKLMEVKNQKDDGKNLMEAQEAHGRAENFKSELYACEQSLERERAKNCNLQEEIRVLKEAINELKQEFTTADTEDQMMPMIPNTKKTKKLNQRDQMLDKQFDQVSAILADDDVQMFQNPLATQKSIIMPQQNHPIIIQKLIQAKIKEKQLMQQFTKCSEKEQLARQEVKKILLDKLSPSAKDISKIERDLVEEKLRREDAESKVRELEIELLRKPEATSSNEAPSGIQDNVMLANAVIALINEHYNDEQTDLGSTIQQDKIYKQIIVQLTRKLKSDQPIDQFMPTNERDQKVWFLELLDSQLGAAEKVTQKLMDFVRKLSIDIQGSLTSAAQIKATSLELASNSKDAASEVLLLKEIARLIRADMEGASQINPFQTGKGFSSIELQNQLAATTRIKAQTDHELDDMRQRLEQGSHQLQVIQNKNKKLEKTVVQLETQLSNHEEKAKQFKDEVKTLKEQHANQGQKMTQKNLSKLQSDITEWRRTSEQALKAKEQKLEKERERAQKAEDQLSKKTAELQVLRSTKKFVNEKNDKIDEVLQQWQLKERAWAAEKEELEKQLKDKNRSTDGFEKYLNEVSQNEVTKLPTQLYGTTQEQTKDEELADMAVKLRKISKKLVKRDDKIKEMEQQLKLNIDKLSTMEQLLKAGKDQTDIFKKELIESKYKIDELNQELRQKVFENNLLGEDRKAAVEGNDKASVRIHFELDQVRRQMSELKMERDQLQLEIQRSSDKEQEWKRTVNQMRQEIDMMHGKISQETTKKELENQELEAIKSQNAVKIKLLGNQNKGLAAERNKTIEDLQNQEMLIDKQRQENLTIKQKYNEAQKHLQKAKIELEERVVESNSHQRQIEAILAQHAGALDAFQAKIDEVNEARANLISLYEEQVANLKNRLYEAMLPKLGKKAEKEVDLAYQLSQREASLKQLKKELQSMKSVQNKKKTQKDKPVKQKDEVWEEILTKVEMANQLQEQLIAAKLTISSFEGDRAAFQAKLNTKEVQVEDLQNQVESLTKSQCDAEKILKTVQQQSAQMNELQQALKLAEQELERVKSTWVQPDVASKDKQAQQKDQHQLKSLQSELNRKKDLITNLKQQKEDLEKQISMTSQDLIQAKEDLQKLQRNQKMQSGNQNQIKQMKQELELCRKEREQMLDDITLAQEKIKQLRSDLSRKEQLLRNMDKPSKEPVIKKEAQDDTDKKIKDLKIKQKTDLQVKDNQIRALKAKLESQNEIIDELKSECAQYQNDVQQDLPLLIKHSQKLEKQKKQDDKKINELESIIEEKDNLLEEWSKKSISQSDGKPQPDINVQAYKEGMDTLGLSMEELKDFM